MSSVTSLAGGDRRCEHRAMCHVLRLRQVGILVAAKLHARFHFGRVGFEIAVACLFVSAYSSIVCDWFLAKVQHGALQSWLWQWWL